MTAPRLPPFAALRGFEAAARLNSFRLAAEELCLSPSAVSHNARQLEEFVGKPLFVRSPKGVSLTRSGRNYLAEITPIFAHIVAATDRAAQGRERRTIQLQCSPGCSSRWLMPQLNYVRDALGDVNIAVTNLTNDHQADAEIRCGYTFPPDGENDVLLTSLSAPVCSEAYLQSHGPIRSVRDLESCTLLEEKIHGGWDDWFEKASPRKEIKRNSVMFDDGYAAMSAAEFGIGVFLGHLSLLAPELANNRLVQLFDETGSQAVVYTLKMRPDWQNDVPLVNLRNCLMSLNNEQRVAAE